jgi:hypothetical protein
MEFVWQKFAQHLNATPSGGHTAVIFAGMGASAK